MYDVTNRASFEALNGWLKEMRTHLEKSSDMEKIIFVVCANKVPKKSIGVPVLCVLYRSFHEATLDKIPRLKLSY